MYYEFGFPSLYLYIGPIELWYDGTYGAGDSLSFHILLGGQYHNLGSATVEITDNIFRTLK